MADPQGLAEYPGIEQIVDWTYTQSHGVSPSVAIVTIAPQKKLPSAKGDLTLRFGSEKVTLKDCVVDAVSYERNSQGLIWRLQIFDRRWAWSGLGKISGFYNVLQADGKIDPKTEKTPKELAELCLDAMGEKSRDVTALPGDLRPETSWDYDTPAQVLASLCDSLGCRVMLGLDNKVYVRKVGDGETLPQSPVIIDDSGTFDPPEVPDKLELVGAPMRFQRQLKLEAVGVDTDGTIKPIDKLSYKPAAGWGAAPEDEWEDITACDARKLARETVFRWYRVIGDRNGTLDFAGLPEKLKVEKIEQLLPLEDEKVEQFTDPLDGRKKNKPAQILGAWYSDEGDGQNSEDDECQEVDVQFSMDRERGIVKFSRPMVLQVGDYDDATKSLKSAPSRAAMEAQFSKTSGDYAPALIWLECAFGVKDKDTRGYKRWTKEKQISDKPPRDPPLVKVVRDDGFVYTNYQHYGDDGVNIGITTNEAELNPKGDSYLKEAAAEFETRQPQEITYAGLVPIQLDGAIQQVTWSGGPQGCTTRASRNTEHAHYVPSYKERRQLEQLAESKRGQVPTGGVPQITANLRKFMDSQGRTTHA